MKVKIIPTDETMVISLDNEISKLLQQINRKFFLTKTNFQAHYQKAILNNKAVLVKSSDDVILELMSELGQQNNSYNIQLVG